MCTHGHFGASNRTVEVPSSRIVLIEGIYALSERLRPLLDLRVSITGGVHFDLVKRVLRDIQRAGQEPAEIIYQISETVNPLSCVRIFFCLWNFCRAAFVTCNYWAYKRFMVVLIQNFETGVSYVQGLY